MQTNLYAGLIVAATLFGIPSLLGQTAAPLIPAPRQAVWEAGEFVPDGNTRLYFETPETANRFSPREAAALLPFPITFSTKRPKRNFISLALSEDSSRFESDESYHLSVRPDGIRLSARAAAGLFYGLQTLRQLTRDEGGSFGVAQVSIDDSPRFPYRGLHLDVSRHFLDKEFIKKQLDAMARLKLNRFHWHLTDGAGWRLQIRKYPQLTEQAAWRPHADWKDWWKGDRRYASKADPGAYGGYYTAEDVREVVAYAAERHITVIPEIEMPGHSEEVLAVLPELSCSGQPYRNGDFCVGEEETFVFLQGVLNEVMELFPSRFIHIGGDEAGKDSWKSCAKCQARMRQEGLESVDELQSYLIKRIDRYLTAKGRTLLGWDEILEGGLAENAAVMSWRGEEGGVKAARMGHQVIMTPGEYCYFDQYQSDPLTEPEAIGGYLPLRKVYSYDPIPKALTDEESRRILGVQANVWTEYMPTPEHTEYMIYPRLFALSEVAWSAPGNKEWERFKSGVKLHLADMRSRGYHVAPLFARIEQSRQVDLDNKTITVSLLSDYDASGVIRYTTDGSDPDHHSSLYRTPICFSEPTLLKAAIFDKDSAAGVVQEFPVDIHKALGKPIELRSRYNRTYSAGGDLALVDGQVGGSAYSDQKWQGYNRDIDLIIDLGETQDISLIKTRFMQLTGPWIWLPGSVTFSVSEDKVGFSPVAHLTHDIPGDADRLVIKEFAFEGKTKGRYIRLQTEAYPQAGGIQFLDEIVVY